MINYLTDKRARRCKQNPYPGRIQAEWIFLKRKTRKDSGSQCMPTWIYNSPLHDLISQFSLLSRSIKTTGTNQNPPPHCGFCLFHPARPTPPFLFSISSVRLETFAMEDVSSAFANAYRSERLIYRDIENSDADKELMYYHGSANHVTWGLLRGHVFRDVSKKQNMDDLGKLLQSDVLLKVMICLPAPVDENSELSKLSLAERTAKERETATVVGSLTLTGLNPNTPNVPVTSVGLAIAEKYQNKGYGGEAISWAVDWAFKFANVHKVEITTASYNERAFHLYKKLGFKEEGRRREVIYVNRKYYDLLQLGMVESDWKALKGLE
ncbi:acyl-CoA N-acyltransferase [Xylariales sp. PMI_506]|nr:acyl-CoA N-acyltransferase [Xylariales sp. PMI_506]